MGDLHVLDKMIVQSHKGPYSLTFNSDLLNNTMRLFEGTPHFIVDANVARLYPNQLADILNHSNVLIVEASEKNKSIQEVIPIIYKLIANKVRRGQTLVGIGGGIIQDITCFIASILLRGIEWKFVPTTLLAMTDSCIGSKSSINVGPTKNILGTYNPPTEIWICSKFLDTLTANEIFSGIGEIIKVHAIEGRKAFDQLSSDYHQLLTDQQVLLHYIQASLEIKKKIIEVDEFDQGTRNRLNYGHSFGHAIESATEFTIPHGIAISIGMDMANYIACKMNFSPKDQYHRMNAVLKRNYALFAGVNIPIDAFLSALMKDKKNTATKLNLILPIGIEANIQPAQIENNTVFRNDCADFLAGLIY